MTDAAAKPATEPIGSLTPTAAVTIWQIFVEFLIMGGISFGGVVPYLRDRLVARRRWLDDKEFVEVLSISQSLPGLNATNVAVLVGEKLHGMWGAVVAILGVCLPGASLMYVVGIFYHLHGDHAWATAALKGVAAAAVGLLLSTIVNLSTKALAHRFDFLFMAATVLAVNRLHWSVPRALILVGVLATLFHRPRSERNETASQ